ncbi:hypothetical protein L2E26_25445, partial [Salmonella enterica subsp. enterica serovar Weltevreden]|uniref:hypothetical protein n=1 Tax=Salmonella enterica TaxID=28901 RepID=UPI001F35992B
YDPFDASPERNRSHSESFLAAHPGIVPAKQKKLLRTRYRGCKQLGFITRIGVIPNPAKGIAHILLFYIIGYKPII